MKQLFLDQMLTINNTLRKLKILSLNNFIVIIKIKLSILEESQVKLPNQKQIIKIRDSKNGFFKSTKECGNV